MFVYIIVMLATTAVWLSIYNCHIAYFILDNLIIGFCIVFGAINLWDPKTSYIGVFWLLYIPFRFLVILVYTTIMKVTRKKIVIRRPSEYILITMNVALNIIGAFASLNHWFHSIG